MTKAWFGAEVVVGVGGDQDLETWKGGREREREREREQGPC